MKNDEQPSSQPLTEGIDYYIERGLWIFTAEYHLRRGRCCDSGCLHCPYQKGKDAPVAPIKD